MRILLIIGCGDIAWRVLPELVCRWRVFALVRNLAAAEDLRAIGVTPIFGDLDDRASLRRLSGLAHTVLHFAPPPTTSTACDPRTSNLISALMRGRKSVPLRILYMSTSGVYGDCAGAKVAETHMVRAQTPRAKRRIAAESVLRHFGALHGCTVSVLRVPGIYAEDRLPLGRIDSQDPLMESADQIYTNHIHADDLAAAVLHALYHGRANRVYNICDDSVMVVGKWMDHIADHYGLPRLARQAATETSSKLINSLASSFMSESRQLDNTRMKRELAVRLRYPRASEALVMFPKERRSEMMTRKT